VLSALRFSISSGLKEKYATSEADKRAEVNRSITSIISPVIILKAGGLRIISERNKEYDCAYSGSKSITFNKTI
jgi:hypothetical protein